jgi:alkylation response protein AidB-like acyl-CoA dehydrogenase
VDFEFTPAQEQFRQELRHWLTDNHPGFSDDRVGEDPDYGWERREAWDRRLYEGGYTSGISWPVQYGGRDASVIDQLIVYQEMARAQVPGELGRGARQILGPTIIRFGTEEQKKEFLPRTLSGEIRWCQGFSEPGAGSDLAGLRTAGLIDGEDLIINGQKTWTSLAHRADWCFLLIRTDQTAPKHRGISFVLVNMRTPGITVHPFKTCVGDADFCDVFFDDVRVPIANVVGQLNDGWNVTRTALSHERATMALSRYLIHQLEVANFCDLLRGLSDTMSPGQSERADEALGRALVASEQARLTGYWNVSHLLRGEDMGSKGSVLKVHFSQLTQRLSEAALDLLGLDILTSAPELGWLSEKWQRAFLFSRASAIYGGTNEIQRNIIAEQLMKLPR